MKRRLQTVSHIHYDSKPEATLTLHTVMAFWRPLQVGKMQDGIVGDHWYRSGLVSRLSQKIEKKIK